MLRIVTYNIRHGLGIDGMVSLERTAQTLAILRPDLVALQEVDRCRARSGFTDQARNLAVALEMLFVFGENRRYHRIGAYGNAVLSRFPILEYRQTLLPSKKEQRGLLEVWIECNEQLLRFGCTHLGLNREERTGQVAAIMQHMERIKEPVILAGDFNCQPQAGELEPLLRVLREVSADPALCPTFPSTQPRVRVDYIFVSEQFNPVSVQIPESLASDHLPLCAGVTF
ncbi:MAG: endonuclease [Desulforudis sp.]|nr:MAG: endonuclease [Desulforudis sp.]